MYAIVETGGKQYKVEEGQILKVEKMDVPENELVNLDRVLLIRDDESTHIGSPYVEGARVEARVVRHGRGRKVIVFKYKRRKDYKKKRGHRQHFTELKIEKISLEGKDGS